MNRPLEPRIVPIASSCDTRVPLAFIDDGELPLDAWLASCNLPAFPAGAWAVALTTYHVLWGRWDGGVLRLPPGATAPVGQLQDLRVFDAQTELHVWRDANGALAGRTRSDGKGEEVETVDERWLLWGTQVRAVAEGWVELWEQRGTRLVLPLTVAADDVPLQLRVRHYLREDELGMPGYGDYRLVALQTRHGMTIREWGEQAG